MPEWEAAEREAYLTLALVPGIGSARFRELLQRFETPSGVLAASLAALRSVPGIFEPVARAVRAAERSAGPRALAAVAAEGGVLLLPGEPGFPAALLEIPEPPTHLFLKGDTALLERPAVAIVGSRQHSEYGGEVCRALAQAAAEAGLVVVSGMARGLDAVAHAGALAVGGGTIGVLGNGLGFIYPRANRLLYAEVAARGLLLTELPPGAPPHEGSFPRRNRLISGLARVTVVVEAAITSGALQTATWAQAQGREVLVVPGPITSVSSAGTNRWLRDGAGPLLELDDLLYHYPELRRPAAPGILPDGAGTPLERRIVQALQREPLPAERLVEASGAAVETALDTLSALELSGKVRRDGEGRYRLAVGLFG
jgi:DNA processing protein